MLQKFPHDEKKINQKKSLISSMSDQKNSSLVKSQQESTVLKRGGGGGGEKSERKEWVKVEICVKKGGGRGRITLRELQQEQTVRLPAVFWRHWWQVRPPILSYTRSPFAS